MFVCLFFLLSARVLHFLSLENKKQKQEQMGEKKGEDLLTFFFSFASRRSLLKKSCFLSPSPEKEKKDKVKREKEKE